jgi:hypothetical protein
MVGVAGFEPAASSSRTKRAAKLRYTPRPLPKSSAPARRYGYVFRAPRGEASDSTRRLLPGGAGRCRPGDREAGRDAGRRLGSRRAGCTPGRCVPARRCVIPTLGRAGMVPPPARAAMLAAATRSRCPSCPQCGQVNRRPAGLGTRWAHAGQVEDVPRSSTNVTVIPATSALSRSALIRCPTRHARTAGCAAARRPGRARRAGRRPPASRSCAGEPTR